MAFLRIQIQNLNLNPQKCQEHLEKVCNFDKKKINSLSKLVAQKNIYNKLCLVLTIFSAMLISYKKRKKKNPESN